jgi:hypothetical protein
MAYVLMVKFRKDCNRVDAMRNYTSFMDKYDGDDLGCTSNPQDGSTIATMFMHYDKPLTKKEIESQLNGLEIVAFEDANPSPILSEIPEPVTENL